MAHLEGLWNTATPSRELMAAAGEIERLRADSKALCWCHTCRPVVSGLAGDMSDMRMVLCPDCGNKRCPKANDHRYACTGSNASGQPGSNYL